MRKAVFGVVMFGALLGVSVALVPSPSPRAGLHLSGDGVAEVDALLTQVPRAEAPDQAAIEVVLLRRIENLRHLPELARLCRDRCGGQALTALTRMDPRGSGKTVVIDLGALGAGAGLDTGGPLEAAVAECAARIVTSEMGTLAAAPPPCAGERRAVRVLSFGL